MDTEKKRGFLQSLLDAYMADKVKVRGGISPKKMGARNKAEREAAMELLAEGGYEDED